MYANEKEFAAPPVPPPNYHKATHSTKDDYGHDEIDQELLAEAGHTGGFDDEKHAGAEEEPNDEDLDKNLLWLKDAQRPRHGSYPRLERPILIPQTDPGIQNSFSRAWSPALISHDIREEDFIHFVDHLNVCKAASPPFQILNLAGNVLGFTPIPYAFAVGMGTQALAAAGTIATAKIRITRYLKRVNHEYFVPRGLVARIAKQATLSQLTGQPEDAPLMAPRGNDATPHPHGLRDRRLAALNGYIAPLQMAQLPPLNEEHNIIDKASAKMMAFKAHRQESKMTGDHAKEKGKSVEENQKLDHEAQKIVSKAERKMAKHPRKRPSIEAGMREDLAKIDHDRRKVDDDFHGKVGDGGTKEMKAAQKFLWIAIGNLDEAGQTGGQARAPGT